MDNLANEMGVARFIISLVVRKDLQCKSFILRNRQLLTEKNKIDRKVKAQALLNDMKDDCADFLKFFSHEKNFIQDRKRRQHHDATFFEKGLKVNADSYIKVLETVVKPWMDEVAAGREYVLQQDSAPAHAARKTQAWLFNNFSPA
ncbi:hypothetical protein DMN91_009247 [Ooceraea biroi]|uniref:Histone-lysine N-methyltransferase SETMAR n=1 Tax=Ooceraea biroi TaxID=2015173 RepID=A0A3L8DG51_OOCBI|nr:hypothetical protein DMN91_009247 [Ooceraea biroi]